jgi:hypothetical protein
LALIWRRQHRHAEPAGAFSSILSLPWLQAAVGLIPALLPRKLRVASLLYRLWRGRR